MMKVMKGRSKKTQKSSGEFFEFFYSVPFLPFLLWLVVGCGEESAVTRGEELPAVQETLTAWAGGHRYVRADHSTTFTAHFAGKVTRVQWDFENDNRVDATLDLSGGAVDSTTHTYRFPGSYKALLRVTDSDGKTAESLCPVTVLANDADVVLGGFGPYYNPGGEPIPGAAVGYDLDPARAANITRYPSLTATQRARLRSDGHVVSPTSRDQMYGIYDDALAKQQALFLSSDALIHAFHLLSAEALRRVELDHLVPALRQLVEALLARTNWQYQRATATHKVRLERSLAYLGVAASLLGRDFELPPGAAKSARAELELIAAHEGFAISPLFGTRQDYGLFLARGHHGRSVALGQYHRARTWLAGKTFRLSPPTEEGGATRGQDETLQALMLTQALYATSAGRHPASALWQQLLEPMMFFDGHSGDLSPGDHATLLLKVYGPRWRSLPPEELAHGAKLGLLLDLAKKLRPDNSLFARQVQRSGEQSHARGMRLMPRSTTPHRHLLEQLVHPVVKQRTLPRGLDMMAAFGSARARKLLADHHGENHPTLGTQLSKLELALSSLTPLDRVQSLHWAWLQLLTPAVGPLPDGAPRFMTTSDAWRDRQLLSALGAWTEQRHDTVMQSLPVTTTAPNTPVVPVVYVEPSPGIYGRLASLTRMLRLGLQRHEQDDDVLTSRLLSLEGLLQQLRQHSHTELGGQDLSVQEMDGLRDIGAQLQKLTTVATHGQRRMALVVDLFASAGQLRQQALGNPAEIYVVVPRDGKGLVARGVVYSYYELTRDTGSELNDSAWQKLLAGSQAPSQPSWSP